MVNKGLLAKMSPFRCNLLKQAHGLRLGLELLLHPATSVPLKTPRRLKVRVMAQIRASVPTKVALTDTGLTPRATEEGEEAVVTHRRPLILTTATDTTVKRILKKL